MTATEQAVRATSSCSCHPEPFDRARLIGPALAILAAAVCWVKSGIAPLWFNDAGYLFDAAHRIASGEVPYRDFFLYATPGTHLVLGLLMKLGGGYGAARAYGSIEAAAGVLLTVWFARRLSLHWALACALGLLSIAWSPNIVGDVIWYDADSTFLTLAAGLLLYRAWTDEGMVSAWALAGGAVAALSFWFKQDIGAGCLFGAVVAGLAWAAETRDEFKAIDLILGILLVFGGALMILAWNGALGAFLARGVVRAISFKWVEGPQDWVTLRKLLSPFTTQIDRSSKVVVMLYAAAPLVSWIAYCRTGNRQAIAAACVSFIWLASFYAGLMTHGGQAYTTKVSTLAASLAVSWRYLPGKRIWGVVAVLLLALRGVSCWSLMSPAPTVAVRSEGLKGFRAAAPDAAMLDAMVNYIGTNVAPSESVLIFDPMLAYFASGRRAPHPVVDMRETTAADEHRIVKSLLASRPLWFISRGGVSELDAFDRMPALKAWLGATYHFYDTCHGFSVWKAQ